MKLNLLFLFAFVFTLFALITNLRGPFLVAMTNVTKTYSGELNLTPIEADDWSESVRSFAIETEATGVTVLMYHRIIAEQDLESWHYQENGKLYDTIVLTDAFAEQMAYLNEQGYLTLTLKEFQLFMVGEIELPEKSVLITFDDGFQDNITHAYPILRRYDFKATIFLITDAVASGDPLYLSEADLMTGSDVFEYQSHTDQLHQRNETGEAYLTIKPIAEVEQDLRASIDKLGGRKRAFAYPYGVYQQEHRQLLADIGFQLAFTVEYKQATRTDQLLEVPRISVFPEDSLDDFKLKLN